VLLLLNVASSLCSIWRQVIIIMIITTQTDSEILNTVNVRLPLMYSDILPYVFCSRFGIGRFTTEQEVDYTAERVIHHVNRLREMRSVFSHTQQWLLIVIIILSAHRTLCKNVFNFSVLFSFSILLTVMLKCIGNVMTLHALRKFIVYCIIMFI